MKQSIFFLFLGLSLNTHFALGFDASLEGAYRVNLECSDGVTACKQLSGPAVAVLFSTPHLKSKGYLTILRDGDYVEAFLLQVRNVDEKTGTLFADSFSTPSSSLSEALFQIGAEGEISGTIRDTRLTSPISVSGVRENSCGAFYQNPKSGEEIPAQADILGKHAGNLSAWELHLLESSDPSVKGELHAIAHHPTGAIMRFKKAHYAPEIGVLTLYGRSHSVTAWKWTLAFRRTIDTGKIRADGLILSTTGSSKAIQFEKN